jgi:hypothetical protein
MTTHWAAVNARTGGATARAVPAGHLVDEGADPQHEPAVVLDDPDNCVSVAIEGEPGSIIALLVQALGAAKTLEPATARRADPGDDARRQILKDAIAAQRTCPVTGVPLIAADTVCLVTDNPRKPRITWAAAVWDRAQDRARTNLAQAKTKILDVLDGRLLFADDPTWQVDAALRADITAVVNYNWLSELTDYGEQAEADRRAHIFRSLQRLRAWLIEDYRAAAAKAQGLGPMHEWLSFVEHIAHEVEDTGGATMIVKVPLGEDGAHLHIVRGDDWTDDPDRQHEQDDWVISHYTGEATPCCDLGAGLSMEQAITLIKAAVAQQSHPQSGTLG